MTFFPKIVSIPDRSVAVRLRLPVNRGLQFLSDQMGPGKSEVLKSLRNALGNDATAVAQRVVYLSAGRSSTFEQFRSNWHLDRHLPVVSQDARNRVGAMLRAVRTSARAVAPE